MRRLVSLLLAALLTIGLVAPVAAGEPPEVIPNEKVTQFFEDSCDFDVRLRDTFARGVTKIYPPKEDGTQKITANGGFRSTLRNLETGDRIKVGYFGHLRFDINADGTILVRQRGAALWWFTDPADSGQFGLDPGIYIIRGKLEVLTDENFFAIAPADMSGVRQVRDLCDELS